MRLEPRYLLIYASVLQVFDPIGQFAFELIEPLHERVFHDGQTAVGACCRAEQHHEQRHQQGEINVVPNLPPPGLAHRGIFRALCAMLAGTLEAGFANDESSQTSRTANEPTPATQMKCAGRLAAEFRSRC